jgi:Mg2+ and Co2+ transporter CorA
LWDGFKFLALSIVKLWSFLPDWLGGDLASEFLKVLEEMGDDIKTVADGTEKEEQRKDKEALAAAVNTNKYLEETRRSLNKSMMSALGLNDANKALAMEGNEHAAGQLAALGDLNTALAQIVINTERPDSGPAKRVEGK